MSPSATTPARPAAAGATRIERIADVAGFHALREEWTELLDSSASHRVFLTWEWLYTWWKHFGAGRALDLILVRQGEELIGLAPLLVHPPRLGRLMPCRTRQFLGTGSVGSDYLDVIVRQGREADALDALAAHLAEEGVALGLAQVNRRAAVARLLADRLERRGWQLAEQPGDVCPYIDLRGLTWVSYLASLGAQHRYNFKGRANKLAKTFEMRFELAASDEDRRAALAALVALHRRRWSTRGGSTALETSALVGFHEEFSRLAMERGWLRLFLLRLDGKPAAALYGIRFGPSFSFYQTGFDPDYGRYGVGQVTVGLTIKHAIEEGAAEYDMLHGDERYKFDWAREVRELARLELYPPSASGRVCRRMAGLDQAARRTARQVFPKTVTD